MLTVLFLGKEISEEILAACPPLLKSETMTPPLLFGFLSIPIKGRLFPDVTSSALLNIRSAVFLFPSYNGPELVSSCFP